MHAFPVSGRASDVVFTRFAGITGIYLSPDGTNPGGGSATELVYEGDEHVTRMTSFGGNVFTGSRTEVSGAAQMDGILVVAATALASITAIRPWSP